MAARGILATARPGWPELRHSQRVCSHLDSWTMPLRCWGPRSGVRISLEVMHRGDRSDTGRPLVSVRVASSTGDAAVRRHPQGWDHEWDRLPAGGRGALDAFSF